MQRSREAAVNDRVIYVVAAIVLVVTALVGALAWAAWCLGETLSIWLDE